MSGLRFVFPLFALAVSVAMAQGVPPAPPPTGALKIVDASDPAGTKLTADSSDFRYGFWIEATGKEDVKDLKLVIAPLIGPNSVRVDPTWTVNGQPSGSAPITIPAQGAALVEVSAKIPMAGAYFSSVSLIQGGGRQSKAFTVTRSRVVPPVEVLGVEPAAEATLWLTLHASGRPVTLNRPALTTLTWNQASKAKVQASYKAFSVTDEGNVKLPDSFTIPADTTQRVKLSIDGLNAGEYTGKVRIAAPDAQPIDVPITLWKKDCILWAIFLILFGVLLSHELRSWLKTGRPKLVLRRNGYSLRAELDKLREQFDQEHEEVRRVLEELRRRLEALDRDLDTRPEVDAAGVLSEIQRKLKAIPDWIEARRGVDAIRPVSLQGQFRGTLGAAEQYFLKPMATEQQHSVIVDQLGGLSASIEKAVRDELSARLNALEADVNASSSAARTNTLRIALQDVVTSLIEAAKKAVAEGSRDAFERVNHARLEYANALLDDLTDSLKGAPPLGFANDAKRWGEARAHVAQVIDLAEEANDPEQRISRYLEAYALYLKEAADALRSRVDAAKETLDSQVRLGHATAEKQKTQRDQLNEVVAKLDAIEPKLKEGKLREAHSDYTAAEKVAQLLAKAGVQLGAVDEVAPGEARGGGLIPAAVGPGVPVLVARMVSQAGLDAERLTRQLRMVDWIFTGVVAIISVLLGVQLLYLDNPTWGGARDFVLAVLWGLGLHQVSGGASEGIAGLRERFSK